MPHSTKNLKIFCVATSSHTRESLASAPKGRCCCFLSVATLSLPSGKQFADPIPNPSLGEELSRFAPNIKCSLPDTTDLRTGIFLLAAASVSCRSLTLPKLRMGAITLPYPQTPFLGKGALSLCSDFDTQRQGESSISLIHPEPFFGAQVGFGGWPSGLTRPSDQSA